jgi:hypothetical protein
LPMHRPGKRIPEPGGGVVRRSVRYFGLALFVALVALPVPGFAGLAVDFTTPGQDFNNGQWSLGWEFHVLAPFTVTQLGFYDDGKNGLAEAHDVGIWDPNGNLMVTGTVQPGDPLVSWWRWTSVTPVVLLPDTGYVIAGVTGLIDNYTWDPEGFVTDPRIQFAVNRYLASAALVYPVSVDPNVSVGFFGPNFSDEGAAIPEPATSALIGGGLLAVVLAFRRRAKA